MIKIRIDREQSLDEHAKYLVKEYAERSKLPRVANVHRAVEPNLCEDCQETFWAPLDSYMVHHPCKGSPSKQETGFKSI